MASATISPFVTVDDDDLALGLVRKPFFSSADTIIDVATAHILNANRGFLAVFSASYFPDAQIVLECAREEGGGNVYRWAEKRMEGEEAPAKLYVQVKAAA